MKELLPYVPIIYLWFGLLAVALGRQYEGGKPIERAEWLVLFIFGPFWVGAMVWFYLVRVMVNVYCHIYSKLVFRNKTAKQCAAMLRERIKNEPADRIVLGILEACDLIDEIENKTEKENTNG